MAREVKKKMVSLGGKSPNFLYSGNTTYEVHVWYFFVGLKLIEAFLRLKGSDVGAQ